MDSGKNGREHFIKQRRNLIAVALFVIFFDEAKLSMSEINILGNKTDIGNLDFIPQALVGVFIYLLWRYFTACREIGGVSKFRYACTEWAEEKLKNKRKKKIEKTKNDNEHDFRVDLIGRSFFKRTYRTVCKQYISGSPPEQHNEEVTFQGLFCGYILLSTIPITFTTSSFSEYVLPYLLSCIALWYGVQIVI